MSTQSHLGSPETSLEHKASRPLLERLWGIVFGYDFFICYAHKDGMDYAEKLSKRLRADFDVFLDVDDYLLGEDWKGVGTWVRRRTRTVLFVATRKAMESKAVTNEIADSDRLRKRIIAIDIGDCLASAPGSNPIARLVGGDRIFLQEAEDSLTRGPTEAVVTDIHRSFKGLRQRRRRGIFVATVIIVLAALLAFALWNARVAENEKEKANRSAAASQSMSLVAQGRAVKERLPTTALILACEAVQATRRQGQDARTLPLAYRALQEALATTGGLPLHGHTGIVDSVVISPNGRWAITGGGSYFSDSTLKRWDLWDLEPNSTAVSLRGHSEAVTAVALSPGGRWVGTGSRDKTVRLWNLEADDPSATQEVLSGHSDVVRKVAFSADDGWLASGSEDRTVRLWDLRGGRGSAVAPRILYHSNAVAALAFSPAGRWLATGGPRNALRLWDVTVPDPGKDSVVLTTQCGLGVTFSPEGHWLVMHDDIPENQRLWDLRGGVPPFGKSIALKGHAANVLAVAFNHDSTLLATGSVDDEIKLWYTESGQLARTLHGHSDDVATLAFTPDGHWLASGGKDQTVRLWNLRTLFRLPDGSTELSGEAPCSVLRGHEGRVSSLACSSNSRWLVTGGSDDRTARLWDLHAADATRSPIVPRCYGGAARIVISQDDRWIASVDERGTVRLWDRKTGNAGSNPRLLLAAWDSKATEATAGSVGEAVSLEFSPNSRWLIAIGHRGEAWCWDVNTDHVTKRSFGSVDPQKSKTAYGDSFWRPAVVAFSPDGREAAIGEGGEGILLWDLDASDQEAAVRTLRGYRGVEADLALDEDHMWVVTYDQSGSVSVWRLGRDGSCSAPVVVHPPGDQPVRTAEISPNGRWLYTACWGEGGSRVRVWDLRPPDADLGSVPVALDLALGTDVVDVAFSPNSQWLVAHIWPERLMARNLIRPHDPANELCLEDVETMAFSAEGDWLLSVGAGLSVCSLRNPEPIFLGECLDHRLGSKLFGAIGAEGRWGVYGGAEVPMRFWLRDVEDLLLVARRIAGRNLSLREWETYLPEVPYRLTFPDLPRPDDEM